MTAAPAPGPCATLLLPVGGRNEFVFACLLFSVVFDQQWLRMNTSSSFDSDGRNKATVQPFLF